MHYILAIIYSVWFLSEVVISRILRSTQGDRSDTDKRSLIIVWVVATVSVMLAVTVDRSSVNPIFANPLYRLTGALLTILGMAIRITAVKTLGRMFTVDITIRKNHELKTDGIYKHIRHPAYAGLLLSFYGLGLAINNWWSFLLVVIPVTIVFVIRIRMEEKVLEEEFGTAYTNYKKKTTRLIPLVY
jgi:protein-S-isoprenylcysteine O-methyltransferase Ste14